MSLEGDVLCSIVGDLAATIAVILRDRAKQLGEVEHHRLPAIGNDLAKYVSIVTKSLGLDTTL